MLNKSTNINLWRREFLIEILVLFLSIRGRINFLQLARYGKYKEQRVIHVLAMTLVIIIVMDILLLQLENAKQIAVTFGKVVRVNAEICTNNVAINLDNL